MNGINKFALVAFVLTLFAVSCLAEVSVSIVPKDRSLGVLELYPNETGELEVVVTNIGAETVRNLSLRFSVENTSLSLLNNSFAVETISETIDALEPNQTKTIFVSVKPKESSQDNQPFLVNYGFETFTHGAHTFVKIVESPLEVQGRLTKSALDLGEGSKLLLNVKNKGASPITNILAEIVVPSGIIVKSQPLSISTLSPGESISDKEFVLDVEPHISGQKKMVLLVSFEDSRGRHVLEKDYPIDIQNRSAVLYVIIIAIIVLVVIALYLKRKPSRDEKPLEAPELKELEGENIKSLPSQGKEVRK